jgi:hypothetical protein
MNLNAIIRRLLRVPPPKLSADDDVAIAERTLGRQLPTPFRVSERLREFLVQTRVDTKPGGPWFYIDGYTGEVRMWGTPPR